MSGIEEKKVVSDIARCSASPYIDTVAELARYWSALAQHPIVGILEKEKCLLDRLEVRKVWGVDMIGMRFSSELRAGHFEVYLNPQHDRGGDYDGFEFGGDRLHTSRRDIVATAYQQGEFQPRLPYIATALNNAARNHSPCMLVLYYLREEKGPRVRDGVDILARGEPRRPMALPEEPTRSTRNPPRFLLPKTNMHVLDTMDRYSDTGEYTEKNTDRPPPSNGNNHDQ